MANRRSTKARKQMSRVPGWGSLRLAGVGGFPALIVEGRRVGNWLHPAEISKRIVASDPEFFPLLDTRTRYWRYFILRGPHEKLSRTEKERIGRLLLRVLADNSEAATERRRKGIGGGDFQRHGERKGNVGPRVRLRWVRRLEIAYGRKAHAIWEAARAESAGAYQHFMRARRILQKGSLDGFLYRSLKGRRDGRARGAFRRLLLRQTPTPEGGGACVAMDFARLFMRRSRDGTATWALAHAKWGTFQTDEARRVFLARVVPWVLFRRPDQRSIYDAEDAEDADDTANVLANPEFAKLQLTLAKTCVAFFRRGGDRVRGDLTMPQVARIVALLKSAIRSGKRYEEPLPAPPLPAGQRLQFLFPGLRLDAFWNLLQDTGAR